MTPERLQQIRHVFECVLELPPVERDLILRETGEHDPALIAEVEKLIYAYERRDGFIERPIANLHSFVSFDEHESDLTGVQIGPYHLLHLLGAGGMGEVWRAEQKSPVRRQVAIKLIKAGMDTREVMARFESERQALALMDHPAIAKVFDAGFTSEGRPYFAMEYVSGIPVTTYCDEHKLTTHERIKLFVRVCEGIQHAHQKAIIHRDIKPSNILVTEVDGRPMPKIIDFGIAKAISQQLTAKTIFTRVGMILGTPDYMSPEQACSAGEDIDTRTDVYSLGVILYELLVGALPFDFRKLAFDEVLRELRTADPPRPSTKCRALKLQAAASNRRTESTVLIRQLRGDLDAITLKALEKNRSLRYSAPSELAADIERHLRSEPVTARPASVRYKLQKYIRRHRVSVAAAFILALLLTSFGIAEAVQLRRTIRERDRADRITQFMTSMFRISNPSESRGNKTTAREILDKASKDIEGELTSDPELQAQMMDVMGVVYYNLGLYPQAESLLRRALQTRRRILGIKNADTAQSMNDLANTLFREGHHVEAETLDRQALFIRTNLYGINHPDTLKSMNNVATALVEKGQYVEAEKLHRKVFETKRALLGPEHPDTLTSMDNLGNTLDDEGRYSEAEALEREALEIKRKVLGPGHPETLRAEHHVADTLYSEGRYVEAEKLHRELLNTRSRILGPDHPETLDSMLALANALEGQHRYKEAELLDREAHHGQQQVLGSEHPHTLLAANNLAEVLGEEGRYQEAAALLREVVTLRSRILGSEHPHTSSSKSKLAQILIFLKRFDEAGRLLREALDVQLRVLGQEHPDVADTTCNLASLAAFKGRPDEALSLLREAVDHGLKPSEALRIKSDSKFKPLHEDPRFKALVAYARQRAETSLH